jgi:hypothetical protein
MVFEKKLSRKCQKQSMHKFALILLLLSSTAIPVDAYAEKSPEAIDRHEIPPDSEMVYRTNLGRADDIRLLIKKGGSIEAKDNNGIGLLFLAAGRKDEEGVPLVQLYIEQGLDLNERDPEGRTPLFYAAKSGNAGTVKFLLDKGVDSYAVDNNAETARTIAYKAGHTDIVDLMDNFVRQKSQEVTDAYERVNKELEDRYKKLEEEHLKTAQLALEAEKQKASLELESQQQKAILALETEKQRLEAAKLRLETAKQSLGDPSDTTPDSPTAIPAPKQSTTSESPTVTVTATTTEPSKEEKPATTTTTDLKNASLEDIAKQTAEIQAKIAETKEAKIKMAQDHEAAIKQHEEEIKKAEEKKLSDTEKAIAEKINESNLTQTLKEQLHREALENKRAEEELAAKLAAEISEEEARIKAAEEAEINAAKKAQEAKEKEATEKAAKALEEEFYDIEVERNLRAQIEAERQWAEYEKSKSAPEAATDTAAKQLEDPATIKAKKELEEKLQQQKKDLFSELIFHNCSFQYWYFCYTTKQSTELEPEELTKAIRVNKDKIEAIQEQLLGEFQVDAKSIKEVSDTAKKRIYKQLDDMPSKRVRHESGVGKISDVRKRCDEVVHNWDLFSNSITYNNPDRSKKNAKDPVPMPDQLPDLQYQELQQDTPDMIMETPNQPQPNFQPTQEKPAPKKKSQINIPPAKSSANYGLNIPPAKSSANYGMNIPPGKSSANYGIGNANNSQQNKVMKQPKNQKKGDGPVIY